MFPHMQGEVGHSRQKKSHVRSMGVGSLEPLRVSIRKEGAVGRAEGVFFSDQLCIPTDPHGPFQVPGASSVPNRTMPSVQQGGCDPAAQDGYRRFCGSLEHPG